MVYVVTCLLTFGSRSENIRRIGEVSKLFIDAGLIVIVAFISPLKKIVKWLNKDFLIRTL